MQKNNNNKNNNLHRWIRQVVGQNRHGARLYRRKQLTQAKKTTQQKVGYWKTGLFTYVRGKDVVLFYLFPGADTKKKKKRTFCGCAFFWGVCACAKSSRPFWLGAQPPNRTVPSILRAGSRAGAALGRSVTQFWDSGALIMTPLWNQIWLPKAGLIAPFCPHTVHTNDFAAAPTRRCLYSALPQLRSAARAPKPLGKDDRHLPNEAYLGQVWMGALLELLVVDHQRQHHTSDIWGCPRTWGFPLGLRWS